MSASLVGSEMCIRDSSQLNGVLHGAIRRTISDQLVVTKSELAGGGNAVSYTHLTLPTICSV
eukprot:12837943-Alexandrium_andersonii.AAC.1